MNWLDGLSWFANAVILVAQWNVGNQHRWAFIVSFIGEAIWVTYAVIEHKWSLAFICVFFALMAVRNYIKWAPPGTIFNT